MTEEKKFGMDPMDIFSKPVSMKATPGGLGILLNTHLRALEKKPGRTLQVLQDSRFQPLPGFQIAYSYSVTLWQKGNTAGNHYHEVKEEIFVVLAGELEVTLQSVEYPGMKETVILRAPQEGDQTAQALFFSTRIAHVVKALTPGTILLVTATAPNVDGDEVHYEVEI